MSELSCEPEHVRWEPLLPGLRRPTLITAFEGWNDAGDAATIAARDLSGRWRGERVARIDPEPFFDFTSSRPSVRLDKSKSRRIDWPSNELRAAALPGADADVVILLGIEPHLRWRTFCEQVVGAARTLEVGSVITLGALLAEVPHSREVEVYGAYEDESVRAELDLRESTYEGPTGIVGVLAQACRDAGIPTLSFWAAVPSYLPTAPSPKAALALVRRVSTALGMPVRTVEMERAAKSYEVEVDKMVARDDEMAEYVERIEKSWDSEQTWARKRAPLNDDPDRLVAEVEEFLRESG